MIKDHSIQCPITAPFYTLNELTNKTERVWLAFHGYGQLAKYFIMKFEDLDPEKNFIVAPQGLSKFYLEGFTGRVGSSWMTKEDRLMEIENQYQYLDAVVDEIGDFSEKKLVYFGFSQGTATMVRYAGYAKLPFEKMILWAGSFPPDIPENAFNFISGNEFIEYFTSKEDPFFKEEMIQIQNDTVMSATGISPTIQWYQGGHKVIAELLRSI